MERTYNEGFKARMVERLSGPHAISASALARETGVAQATLSRWLLAAATVETMAKKTAPASPATTWTPEQKLAAVLEATALAGEDLGAWLRRKGLHAEQLAQWRAAALAGLDTPRPPAPPAASTVRRVKALERELARKEKALAEAAALLVLRKKVAALWADGADDTDEETET